MNVRIVTDSCNPALTAALQTFESQFHYPLGQGWFRISHGQEYLGFYRSMGQARAIIVEDSQGIAGVCCATKRELHHPRYGSRQILYLGDLKLAQRARSGRILWTLLKAIQEHFSEYEMAYSVVMHGTPQTPDLYTGRAGLPAFFTVGAIRIWRLATAVSPTIVDPLEPMTDEQGFVTFRQLATDQCYCIDGVAPMRSEMTPQWWQSSDGQACARLEDTRRVKRLFRDDGTEIVSAHLSAFAYTNPSSGHQLLQALSHRLAQSDCPALFLALPESLHSLPAILKDPPEHSVITGATVYGNHQSLAGNWNVFTAEI
jgi:hypothetical protein